MAGETEMRPAAAMAGIEILDIGGARLRKRQPDRAESCRLEKLFEIGERPALRRRHGRTADQGLEDRNRVHARHIRGYSRSRSLIEVLARVLASTRLTITAQ